MLALNNGSMSEEPIILGEIMRRDGHRRVAIAHESSLIGQEYLAYSMQAYTHGGMEIVAQARFHRSSTTRCRRSTTYRV